MTDISSAAVEITGTVASAAITALIPFAINWLRAKTHSETLATATKVGGAVAYEAMVALTQSGKLDYAAARRAALQAGIMAVSNIRASAVQNLSESNVATSVTAGLGNKLAIDPTVSALGKSVATAVAAPGETASAVAGDTSKEEKP